MDEKNINDLINNLKNITQNNQQSTCNIPNTQKKQTDLNISPEMLDKLSSVLNLSSNQNGKTETTSSTTNQSYNNIDFQTLLKIKSIMESFNKNDDPRANLLYSLKPYLRDSRKKKIDQYINLFKLTNISNLFKNEDGDSK